MTPTPVQTYLPGCAPRGYEEHEYRPPAPAAKDDASERRRVSGQVQRAVLDFFLLRIRNGAPVFHMGDLTRYVADRVPTAPDSAGRIMRALHGEGRLTYELVSRSRSEYRALLVAPQETRT